MLLDQPIVAETTGGHLVAFTGRAGRCSVRRVLSTWQAPGEARLYRLQVHTETGPAIAEVAGPHERGDWRLLRIWT